MLRLKVVTVGDAVGVALPKEALTRLKVSRGDTVCLVETAVGYEILPLDAEFAHQMRIAKRGMRKQQNALRALAR